jgi:hypothetical protein
VNSMERKRLESFVKLLSKNQSMVNILSSKETAMLKNIAKAEMEFLNINLTNDSSFLLHAIHRPFYWRILKENHTLLQTSRSKMPFRNSISGRSAGWNVDE